MDPLFVCVCVTSRLCGLFQPGKGGYGQPPPQPQLRHSATMEPAKNMAERKAVEGLLRELEHRVFIYNNLTINCLCELSYLYHTSSWNLFCAVGFHISVPLFFCFFLSFSLHPARWQWLVCVCVFLCWKMGGKAVCRMVSRSDPKVFAKSEPAIILLNTDSEKNAECNCCRYWERIYWRINNAIFCWKLNIRHEVMK